nr:hypothetical protein [Tanacetum cinerariifolium]
MDKTIDQQVALDKALIPHASRLRIGKRNFALRSDITSKESTLQLVYDVLRLTPFYKVFLLTTDVPEIYMQEFWATAKVRLGLVVVVYRSDDDEKPCINNNDFIFEYSAFVINLS